MVAPSALIWDRQENFIIELQNNTFENKLLNRIVQYNVTKKNEPYMSEFLTCSRLNTAVLVGYSV